ncbi:hypothetical protein M2239_006890 [Bradyrhizobium elkanii]|nr:hypothetical protein [Bradyrhizobium elkanii]
MRLVAVNLQPSAHRGLRRAAEQGALVPHVRLNVATTSALTLRTRRAHSERQHFL